MKQIILLIAVLGLMLAGALWGASNIWFDSADAEIGFHGTLALILGGVASLLVGGGLMVLVFYSSRHGYDDEAGR